MTIQQQQRRESFLSRSCLSPSLTEITRRPDQNSFPVHLLNSITLRSGS